MEYCKYRGHPYNVSETTNFEHSKKSLSKFFIATSYDNVRRRELSLKKSNKSSTYYKHRQKNE